MEAICYITRLKQSREKPYPRGGNSCCKEPVSPASLRCRQLRYSTIWLGSSISKSKASGGVRNDRLIPTRPYPGRKHVGQTSSLCSQVGCSCGVCRARTHRSGDDP